MKKTFLSANLKYDKEHVTSWMYKNDFKKENYFKIFNKNYSNLRLTLDNINDYVFFIKNDKLLKDIATKKNMEKFLNKL